MLLLPSLTSTAKLSGGGISLSCQEDYKPSCVRECRPCMLLARSACKQCLQPTHRENADLLEKACGNSSSPLAGSARSIRWIHIPKCGSTLAISVVRYACQDQVQDWHVVYMARAANSIDIRMGHAIGARHGRGARCGGRLELPFVGHEPVLRADALRLSQRGGLVIMLRQPAQRLISAFLDNYHAWGLTRHSNRTYMKQVAPTVDLWARFPGVAHCMTKMLSGRDCAALLPPSQHKAAVKQAVELLRSDAIVFVGLVEEWTASICLFHRTLGAGTRPIAGEFRSLGHSQNSRIEAHGVMSKRQRCLLRDRLGECFASQPGRYNTSVLGDFVDELDERVYLEGTRVFEKNVRRHNLEHLLKHHLKGLTTPRRRLRLQHDGA